MQLNSLWATSPWTTLTIRLVLITYVAWSQPCTCRSVKVSVCPTWVSCTYLKNKNFVHFLCQNESSGVHTRFQVSSLLHGYLRQNKELNKDGLSRVRVYWWASSLLDNAVWEVLWFIVRFVFLSCNATSWHRTVALFSPDGVSLWHVHNVVPFCNPCRSLLPSSHLYCQIFGIYEHSHYALCLIIASDLHIELWQCHGTKLRLTVSWGHQLLYDL